MRDEPAAGRSPGRFFFELASRAHEPLLRKASGSMRFDIVDGRRTPPVARRGRPRRQTVTPGSGGASCVMRCDRAVFDKVASGKLNAVAAVLRGDLAVEGDWRLLVHAAALPGTTAKAHLRVNDGLVKILDGNTFVVSDARRHRGVVHRSDRLFSFDTRFLSRWVLTVNGERLNPLSVDDLQYFETRFFLVPGMGTVYIDAKLGHQAAGRLVGFHEELTILNHADEPVADRSRGCRLRFCGPVRGQGCLAQEGSLLGEGRAPQAHARL